jgi:monoamine oxidase
LTAVQLRQQSIIHDVCRAPRVEALKDRNGSRHDNALQTMKRLTRRSFLAAASASAASVALAARPAFAQAVAPADEIDVLIVGAGAAGIAVARKLASAGRSFTLVEATGRVGGRCYTETASFGVPFDRGAHAIHAPDLNPLTKLAARTGLDIYPAPPGQRVRIGKRNAREGELEDFLSALVRSHRAIDEAARGRADVDCAQALPKDLGDWRASVEFALGPYSSAKNLGEISALDFSKSVERDTGAFCRQGYGALLAKLAEGIPVQFNSPVTQIDTAARGGRVEATTPNGALQARYAIVTVSTNVITSGAIKMDREWPRRHLEAAGRLKLGSFDHIALELIGNPLGLQPDDLVFEKAAGPRTAALLANVSGTPLALVEVGGRFGRELSAQGDAAMVDFAVEWLTGLFGGDIRRAVRRTRTTHWDADPWTLGAFSTAAPGAQGARRILMEPIRDRVYLAGEALHETMWGTVGGAWESGERAADAVLRRLAGLPEPAPVRTVTEPPPPRAARGRGRDEPETSRSTAGQRPRGSRKQSQPKPAPRKTRRKRRE